MNFILDTNGIPISALPVSLVENSDSLPVTIRVECVAGRYLASAGHASAQVLARRSGTGDAYADLSVSPLDLTPYDGEIIDFDLKLHAGAVASMLLAAIRLRVTPNP